VMDYHYQISAFYLMNTISHEPVKKVRILCEALMGWASNEKRGRFEDLYKIAVALDSAKRDDEHLCIAWPFENNETNYNKFIKPWLKLYPDFQYMNELEKEKKLSKLKYIEYEKEVEGRVTRFRQLDFGWENFYAITTKLGLSTIALDELKAEFSVYAMGTVMGALTEMLKDVPALVPSSALKAQGKTPTEKFEGITGRLDAT